MTCSCNYWNGKLPPRSWLSTNSLRQFHEQRNHALAGYQTGGESAGCSALSRCLCFEDVRLLLADGGPHQKPRWIHPRKNKDKRIDTISSFELKANSWKFSSQGQLNAPSSISPSPDAASLRLESPPGTRTPSSAYALLGVRLNLVNIPPYTLHLTWCFHHLSHGQTCPTFPTVDPGSTHDWLPNIGSGL